MPNITWCDLPEDVSLWPGLPLSLSGDEVMPLDYHAGRSGWLLYGRGLDKQRLTQYQSKLGAAMVIVAAWCVEDYQVIRLAGSLTARATRLAHEAQLDVAPLGKIPHLRTPGLLVMDMDSTAIQIDGEAWHQFSQQYNAQTQALLAQPEIANNPELYQEKVTEAFFSALPLMLKGDPVITIAPLSWKNSQGESALNLSLFLKDPATTKEAPQTLAQEVDRSVKSLDAKLTIPVDMATEFMTQVAKLEGYQEDQAKKLAKQQVEGASAMGQMFRLTTLQDNTITTSLQYANGQITLNGQKMSLEDFVGMFAMPALNVPAVPAIPQQ